MSDTGERRTAQGMRLLRARLLGGASVALALVLLLLSFVVPASQGPVLLAGAVLGGFGALGCLLLGRSVSAAVPVQRSLAVRVLLALAAAAVLAPLVVLGVAGGTAGFTTIGLATVVLPAVVLAVTTLAELRPDGR